MEELEGLKRDFEKVFWLWDQGIRPRGALGLVARIQLAYHLLSRLEREGRLPDRFEAELIVKATLDASYYLAMAEAEAEGMSD